MRSRTSHLRYQIGAALAGAHALVTTFVMAQPQPNHTPRRGDNPEKPAASAAPIAVEGAAPTVGSAVPTTPEAPSNPQETPSSGVIVVGNRTPPRSASEVVRDKAVLQAAPHRTANDLLVVVPGLHITQHSGEGKAYQIFFRGFDAVHGQDLEIWAAGAPVNDVSNVHGQGYADLHFLMPEVVRQIKASPGTYDPRQGDFAVAGSLSMDLGYDEPGVTAKAQAGSFGTRRYFLAYHPAGQSDATFAAFEVYSTDGFGPSRAARRTSAVAQDVFDLGHGVTARVMGSAYAGRFDSAGVLRLSDVESGAVDRFSTYDPKQGGASSRIQIVSELTRLNEGTRATIAPYVVVRHMSLRQDYTGFLDDPANGDLQEQINDATTIGLNASYRRPVSWFADNDTLEGGVSFRSDSVTQSQKRLATVDGSVTAEQVNATVRGLDAAGYVDAALHPIKRLTLRGGVRLDGLSYSARDSALGAGGQERTSQGVHLGKKATLDLLLSRGLHAVVSYGEGFRSPQIRSLSEGQSTPFTSVISYEGGVRFASDGLAGSASVFQTLLTEDLVFDPATARNERVGPTKRTGAGVELTATPARWFVSSTSVTYTRAEFRTRQSGNGGHDAGDLVPFVPQTVARTDIAFAPVLARIRERSLLAKLGAGMSLLDRRPLPYGQMGHSVFLVDAAASLRWGAVQIGVDAFNLLDAKWYDGEFLYASNFSSGAQPSILPQRHVTVGAPRTILGSLTLFL